MLMSSQSQCKNCQIYCFVFCFSVKSKKNPKGIKSLLTRLVCIFFDWNLNTEAMGLSDEPSGGSGLNSPDPLIREAYLMAYDYLNYVTSPPGAHLPPPPCPAAAALRHAGDELLIRFPIFFRRWPRVFQDVTENTACIMLTAILDEHFGQAPPGGRRRDLAWSAVLSVYVLAGQMALHCHDNGMDAVVPQLQECVGAYVERVICPEIREHGGWVSDVYK